MEALLLPILIAATVTLLAMVMGRVLAGAVRGRKRKLQQRLSNEARPADRGAQAPLAIAVKSDVVGLPDVHHYWRWQNCTSAQAVQRLAAAMEYRHQIAHGVNPRPAVTHAYADRLLRFFTLLGLCTDRAVRAHFVAVHGIANPWPE